MSLKPDLSLAGYTLLSFWMGVLFFHLLVVVPVATKVLEREKLGEFALSVQEAFHRWGMILTALSTVLLVLSESYAGALLSGLVFASVLSSEFLRRRVRRLLTAFKTDPSDEVKREIFNTYRLIAYVTYTQAIAGLVALIIGWLRL